MLLGIGSYTFAWAVGVPGYPPAQPLGPLALLHRARQLEVRVVQFADNLPLSSLRPAELDELEACAREFRLQIEVGTRGLDHANLRAYLHLARRFQSPFVRLVTHAAHAPATFKEIVAALRPVVPWFADAGIKLALENHDHLPARAMVELVETLGPDHVGICLDTVNSFGAAEGLETIVPALAPYALNLHLKDFMIERVPSQMGFNISGSPAGQGRLPVPWLLEQVRLAHRNPTIILELWTPWDTDLDHTIAREASWAETSIRYLRQHILN